ncbi:CCR4-NOT transcription complex, subunit 3 [Blomia tropicalis]|nr:CCR4-NOT transcription complex, subunit 3 [Blomia tropicalis]
MADRRKLQGEIDRCLKKVAEGVETFEDIWQKVHNATNTNQKEKYEADLKKEIKKLQRLRDQIKTWLASSDIKDKRLLVDNRKLIETQMERFKVVERETKTKAYSKEGLGAAQKLDPIQKEKDEINNWLSSSIDTLGVQVDQFESEIEALQIVQKKGKKMAERERIERTELLKSRVEKHRYHVKQLETLMRMLDNETVTVDQIKKIKDDIEYYIESSQEDDFQDNDYIYDDLDLEDMIAFRANNVVDSTNCPLTKSASTTSASESKANNSSNAASVDNDDSNAQSNSSSTNDSPVPSPGLVNCHSNSKTTNNATSEFAFNSSNNGTNIINNNSATAPYAAAVASLANASTKVLQSIEISNDTRTANNASNSSAHHDPLNHHTSNTTVVTLYSAAAAASASVSSTASVNNSPWNNTITASNADLSSHPLLGTRQVPNGGSSQLTLAQQQLIIQQQHQQQQHANHLMNGFKLSSVESQNLSNLKSVTQQQQQQQQQNVSSNNLEEHLESSVLNALTMNMGNMSMANNTGVTNQMGHINELANSVHNSSSNASIHVDPSNLFVKNNLLIHSQGSQLTMQATSPAASVSPSNNLNSVSSVQTNLSSNFNNNNISNMETSMNAPSSVNSSVNTQLVNSTSQSQNQNYFASFGKSGLSKQFFYQMQILEAASRHPIIPLDSYRQKPLTKIAPGVTSPFSSNYPSQVMPQFESIEFYQRMTPETLFFIFYYMEGTKAQYMAAKTLKNQSWRFHTKCMMWFQRLEEPKMISDDYEQGTYIYFDFERWQQRKRENFIFEYKFLEDKELN